MDGWIGEMRGKRRTKWGEMMAGERVGGKKSKYKSSD